MKFFTFACSMLLLSFAGMGCQMRPKAVVPPVAAVAYIPSTATDPKAPLHVTPIHTANPEVYSGISGPGHPVVGDGYGGYRTGREGTMYRGTEPAKPGWLDLGDRARGTAVRDGLIPPLRPIWEMHLRDTIINRGGDGFYYMTGSTGDNIWDVNSGIELWRSKDLKQWDYIGLVWSFVKDATWEKRARYVWAPEIHYVGGNYYFAYCVAGGQGGGTGILKSSTGRPEGPYIYALASGTHIGGGIDATLFEDDDGSVYFSSGGAGAIRKMLPGLAGFDGEPHSIEFEKPADGSWTRNNIAQEGASLFKHNGIYYLGGAAFYQGRYSSVVARSTNIFGPYTNWEEAVPCGGGGNYFKGPDGFWYCTCFGNDDQSPWREKPGIVRIDFAADGRIKIADDQPAFILQKGAPTHWRTAVNLSASMAVK
jgi:xylan 1,4-beta-xylosidase